MAKVIYSEIDNNPLFSGLAEVLPDISYSAAHPELKMTIIFPQAARRLDDGRNYPTIVFVQGSGWTSPNIYYEIPQLSRFAQLGYIVATLTHRSALDGHRAPAFLEDVKTAIRFLREKAEEYKVDPHRIGIWGTSSGGNTALLAGLTGGDPAYRTDEYPEQADHVRMVVDCWTAMTGSCFMACWARRRKNRRSGSQPSTRSGWSRTSPIPRSCWSTGTKTPSSPMSRARRWPRPSPATASTPN